MEEGALEGAASEDVGEEDDDDGEESDDILEENGKEEVQNKKEKKKKNKALKDEKVWQRKFVEAATVIYKFIYFAGI